MTYLALLLSAVLLGTAACGGDGDPQSPATPETSDTGVPLEEGDPTRGKGFFLAAGCGGCHTFTPAGPAGSSRNVGPNLEEAAKMYPSEFLLESIVDPRAYLEKGGGGSIGGTQEYGGYMPAYGPSEPGSQYLTGEQLADLVAFLESGAGR